MLNTLKVLDATKSYIYPAVGAQMLGTGQWPLQEEMTPN